MPKLTAVHARIEDGALAPPESVDVAVLSPPYFQRDGYHSGLMEGLGFMLGQALKQGGRAFMVFGQVKEALARPFEAAHLLARGSLDSEKLVQCQTIIWVKSLAIDGVTRGHYQPINSPQLVNYSHEYVFQFVKGDPDKARPLNRLALGVPFADKTNLTRGTRGKHGDLHCRGDVWFIPQPTTGANAKKLHRHSFPLQLALNCLALADIGPGQVVMDPFIGGGTSALAAFQVGADFWGQDADKKAVAGVKTAWANLGGEVTP